MPAAANAAIRIFRWQEHGSAHGISAVAFVVCATHKNCSQFIETSEVWRDRLDSPIHVSDLRRWFFLCNLFAVRVLSALLAAKHARRNVIFSFRLCKLNLSNFHDVKTVKTIFSFFQSITICWVFSLLLLQSAIATDFSHCRLPVQRMLRFFQNILQFMVHLWRLTQHYSRLHKIQPAKVSSPSQRASIWTSTPHVRAPDTTQSLCKYPLPFNLWE